MKKTRIIRFVAGGIFFGICFFLGEYLVDLIFKFERDAVKIEMFQSLFIGFFVHLMFTLFLKKSKKQ